MCAMNKQIRDRTVLLVSLLLVGLICVGAPSPVWAYWIWSPKTQQWKNPKNSPLATPQLQLDSGIRYFEKQQYKEAIKEFKKLLAHYADAKEAAEARYYIGRAYEGLKDLYAAFKEYQKVIDSYPQSARIKEIIQRQFDIGESFLSKTRQKFLGVKVTDLVEHPSLEIFKAVINNDPYSELAIKAQYKLGALLKELHRYEDAIAAFNKVVDNYPDSTWVEAAKFQSAQCTVLLSGGYQYDTSGREETIKTYQDFVDKHPDVKLSEEARADIERLNENEAHKKIDIAHFYELQKDLKSALIYYEYVASHFPKSSWGTQAQQKVNDLKEVVRPNEK